VLDTPYFEQTCQQVIDLRESLIAQLTSLGYKVLPSHANFIFARPKDGNASAVASALREQGIIVRHFDKPRVQEYLRITIGTQAQHERLIEALKAL
jgi:histidinol-phosphate aminotransferase